MARLKKVSTASTTKKVAAKKAPAKSATSAEKKLLLAKLQKEVMVLKQGLKTAKKLLKDKMSEIAKAKKAAKPVKAKAAKKPAAKKPAAKSTKAKTVKKAKKA